MALDGIYVEDGAGETVFQGVGPPTDAEVARVAIRIHTRVMHLMEQRRRSPRSHPEEEDSLRLDEPLLAELYSASIVGRVATGPRAGRRIVRVGDEPDCRGAGIKSGQGCALIEGFSVHAGVCSPARDRIRLERLLRYCLRPPLSTERLSALADGRLLYKLKRRWSDGTTHVIYEPMELIERLAALVPPPRLNITRFYGVLGPAATFRSWIVPKDEREFVQTHSGCRANVDTSKFGLYKSDAKPARPEGEEERRAPADAFELFVAVSKNEKTVGLPNSGFGASVDTPKTEAYTRDSKRGRKPRNYSWAQLMMRVFELDVLSCPRCGSRMRVLCAIHSPNAIQKILTCLGLPSRAPPIAPATPEVDETFSF